MPNALVRTWKQHGRTLLGEIQPLAGPLVGVNYNRWVTEAGYRRELARRLFGPLPVADPVAAPN
ncbi:MAG: hypothetical protein R3310_00500 [Candidatus Competibacteraceae bacterium]|nr:hypothetical protein [Candidatus Competibacteraceae bacterium]